jgi:hypothetical protein
MGIDFPQLLGQRLRSHKFELASAADVAQASHPDETRLVLAKIEETSFWFRHRNAITNVVGRFSGSTPLFDVGGGNGFVSLGLQGRSVTAIVAEPGIDGANVAFSRGLP